MRNRGASWFPTDEERELREARTVENLARAKADRSADRAERYLTWLEEALSRPSKAYPSDPRNHDAGISS